MKDLSILVSKVRKKSEKLLKKYDELAQHNVRISEELEKAKKELELKSQRILDLEDKAKLLKIAGSVDESGTKEVKLKINEMVREIDKCIAQINR